MNYPKIEQKLYRVWDDDKKDWWVVDYKITNTRLNGFFSRKQDAEVSIKFWKRQSINQHSNSCCPQHYTIVEFNIVENNNEKQI
jgi:uncharacterized protein YutD